jgi:hypothetical protein
MGVMHQVFRLRIRPGVTKSDKYAFEGIALISRVANPPQCFQLKKSRERMVAPQNGDTHVPV